MLAIFVIAGPTSGSFYQAIGSDTYDPTKKAPSNLHEVSELAKYIGTIIDLNPQFKPLSEEKATNKAVAIAKMKAIHASDRTSEYDEKSYFNTKDPKVLEKIYNAVESGPKECMINNANIYSLILDINPKDVGINSDDLGYVSTKDSTPTNRVLLVISGIKTSSKWDISSARITSVYPISKLMYGTLQSKAAKTINS
ncbi:MAG: hypothetical protein IBJ00_02585 [Alphaproteobacteria bacterium]|nr:hypothetical protein [Alphaproteobacteria bacterium]